MLLKVPSCILHYSFSSPSIEVKCEWK